MLIALEWTPVLNMEIWERVSAWRLSIVSQMRNGRWQSQSITPVAMRIADPARILNVADYRLEIQMRREDYVVHMASKFGRCPRNRAPHPAWTLRNKGTIPPFLSWKPQLWQTTSEIILEWYLVLTFKILVFFQTIF